MTIIKHKGLVFSVPPQQPEQELPVYTWSSQTDPWDWPCKFRSFRWRCTRWWYFWQWPSVLYARIRWRVVLKKLGKIK